MGRLKKNNDEKKIKITVSVDREFYYKIKDNLLKPSRLINQLLKEYYGKKNMY